MNPVRDTRWFMYQQSNFLCYINFNYKSLTDRDDAFYMFNGKVLCRAKLFSWDGRYVKENQPHLEKVLASPLFSLEKSFLFSPPSRGKCLNHLKTYVGIVVLPPTKKGKDFIQLCVMKKVVYLRTFKREQDFIGYRLFLVERQGCGCVSAQALDGDLSSESIWRGLVEMAVGRCEGRAGTCCL